MNFYRAMTVLLVGASALGTMSIGCDTQDPTKAVVENAFAPSPDGGDLATQTVVYKVWWVATLFKEPVLPGATSEEERSVPADQTAYALLAPGWDPASGNPPAKLIAMKSKSHFQVARGGTLHIVVSDATFAGSCSAAQALSQEDADFVTQRIFPGEFAAMTYDAETCTVRPRTD